MKYLIFTILIIFFKFNVFASEFSVLEKKLENIEIIDKNLKRIIDSNFSYGAIKIKGANKLKTIKFKYGFLILKNQKIKDHDLNLEGYIAFVPIEKDIPSGRREGRDVLNELGKMSLKSKFNSLELCKMSFTKRKLNSFNKYGGAKVLINCNSNLLFVGKVSRFKSTRNIFGVMADWAVEGYKMDIFGQFNNNENSMKSTLMLVFSEDVSKGVSNVIPNYLKAYVNNEQKIVSKKISLLKPKIIIQEDKHSKKIAEQKTKELELEKKKRIAEQIQRKILEEKTQKLAEEKSLVELKAKKKSDEILKEVAAEKQKKIEKERALRKAEKKVKEREIKLKEEQQKTQEIAKRLDQERKKSELKAAKFKKSKEDQLAALEKQKAENQKLILEEKKKRDQLEKKLAALEQESIKNNIDSNQVNKVKLPKEWIPFKNNISIQQLQFCQLTNRFLKDMDKAISSRNEIRINMVHKDRQQNLDGLIPGGKVNNWIFKVVKIDQVEDGSAAVVLSLQCKSFVGSGQIHTKSTWLKKSNKEWRATIPYDDRRFRELAKLGVNDFVLGSGTFLEVKAFKPGQVETFYASQQIGEHPLTRNLNLEGELFLADLSYIAALN